MKLLAIDCAAGGLSLAAVDDGRDDAAEPFRRDRCRVRTHEGDGGSSASAQALPRLLDMLHALGWSFDDVGAVAFGAGPGGFTGLRTACAVAQGLAFARHLPVVPVDSLALVAEDAADQLGDALPAGAPVWVLMDARMDEIYAGCYRREADGGTPLAGGWQILRPPGLLRPEDLGVAWRETPPAVLAGSALGVFGERLPAPGPVQRVPRERSRARALGLLAAAGLARGQVVPPHEALPVYVRDKVALTTVERLAARPAGSAVR